MNLLSEEEIKPRSGLSFAPMIDFLFLMMALFATLAISRATLLDTDVDLVQLNEEKEANIYQHAADTQNIHLSINAEGEYKWMTEMSSYLLADTEKVQQEIIRQYEMGLFPKEKEKTEVLLHIDKNAPWEVIAKLIFAVREIGFQAHPIYEPG